MAQVPVGMHPCPEALHETPWADAGQLDGLANGYTPANYPRPCWTCVQSLNKGLKTAWRLLKLFIQFVNDLHLEVSPAVQTLRDSRSFGARGQAANISYPAQLQPGPTLDPSALT